MIETPEDESNRCTGCTNQESATNMELNNMQLSAVNILVIIPIPLILSTSISLILKNKFLIHVTILFAISKSQE